MKKWEGYARRALQSSKRTGRMTCNGLMAAWCMARMDGLAGGMTRWIRVCTGRVSKYRVALTGHAHVLMVLIVVEVVVVVASAAVHAHGSVEAARITSQSPVVGGWWVGGWVGGKQQQMP